MSGQGGRPAHAVDMPDMQGSVRWGSIQIYRIFFFIFSFGPYSTLYLSMVNSDPACTAKTQYRQFEKIISRKGIARPQSHFQHSCVCMSDLCIPTIDLPILLEEICVPILGIYNIIRSQTHDGNWDWATQFPEKEYINGIFGAVWLKNR